MNTESLIEKSRKILNNFDRIEEYLYKGIYRIEGRVAGIYFLNFGGNVDEEAFNRIQYKYISEEFYKYDNGLQFNIYLLFITSKADLDKDLEFKIINDDKYARKLILNEDEFTDYFKLEDSKDEDLPDIVSLWKEKLQSVDLQEVYGVSTYTSAVDNFINNKTIKEIAVEKTSKGDKPYKINTIDNIVLNENYRKYPLQRQFNFTKVNLINGVNGAGKTSLLESIELLLAGKSYRNKEQIEPTEAIQGFVNKTQEEIYTPDDIDKYRNRDNFWYNRNINKKGNNCYLAFNQFNFFNTDAAYQFASSSDQEDIKSAMEKIILGGEYSYIKERIDGFESRLSTEFKALQKQIDFHKENIKEANKSIQQFTSKSDLPNLKEIIKSNISKLNYLDDGFAKGGSLANVKIDLLKINISQILNENITDFTVFKGVQADVIEKIKSISNLKDEYISNEQQIIDISQDLFILHKQQAQISDFIKYFSINNFMDIADLEQNNQKLQEQIYRIENIKIKLPEFFIDNDENRYLSNEIEKSIKRIAESTEQINREEKELKILNNSFSIIDEIINKIKLSGEEYLKQVPDSNSCPLCEQEILHYDLKSKISLSFKKDETISVLKEKSKRIDVLVNEKNIIINRKDQLEELIEICKDENIDINKNSINDILYELKLFVEKEEYIRNEIKKVKQIEEQLISINGSIDEFIFLKKEIEAFSNLKIDDSESKSIINSKAQEYLNKAAEKRGIREKLNKELSNIELLLNQYAEDNKITGFDETIRYFLSKEQSLINLESNFEILRTILNIQDNTSLYELRKNVEILESNINQLRMEEAFQKELEKAEASKSKSNQYIELNTPAFNRLESAIKVLKELKNYNGDELIQEYFDNNINEIKDIFKTIHSPKEFTDVKFEKGKPFLYKEELKHSINQISTGQRAALAISIFISLNRKLKNGPQILLFDDPVTYIDDFNALSFLDFLRYFLVKEKKQIFFATANKKFSTLFKKKFEFLGNDFAEFPLVR